MFGRGDMKVADGISISLLHREMPCRAEKRRALYRCLHALAEKNRPVYRVL